MKRIIFFLLVALLFNCASSTNSMLYGILPLSIPESNKVCPIIGTPEISKYYDNTNTNYKENRAFLPVNTKNGEVLWRENVATNGRSAILQPVAEEFINFYEKTCGDVYKDKLSIPYFASKANLKEKNKTRIEELSQIVPNLKNKVADLAPTVEKQESIIAPKKEALASLESEISDTQPKTYTIVGEVIRKEKDSIFLFGTSFSHSSSDMVSDPGFGSQCNFQLDKLEPSDYLSPKLSTNVKVENVVFVKESQAVNRFGHTVRLLQFNRHPTYSKNLINLENKKDSLRKEIDLLQEKVNPLKKELSDAQVLIYEYDKLLEEESKGK